MKNKEIIIVGAGISGLSAGIYALKNGFSVTIIEKNKCVGGLCTTWVRKKCFIDGCVHWISANNQSVMKQIYEDVEFYKGFELIDNDFFFEFYYNDASIKVYKDIQKFKDNLLIFASEKDKESIDILMNDITSLFAFPITFSKPFYKLTLKDQLSIGKEGIKSLKAYERLAKISIEEYANRFETEIINEFIKSMMPSCFSVNILIGIFALFMTNNADYYAAKSSDYTNNMLRLFKNLGGKIIFGEEIVNTTMKGTLITSISSKNNTYYADKYIFSCSTPYVIEKILMKKELLADYYAQMTNDIHDKTISTYYISFKVDKSVGNKLPHYFILKNFDKIKCVENINDSIGFKYYSHITNMDGSHTLICLIDQNKKDYLKLKLMQNDKSYNKLKKDIAEKIKNLLINKFNFLKNNLELIDVATQLTFERYTNTMYGSYLTSLPTPNSKFKFLKNKIEGIDNLYLASQWLTSLGGIPGALMNGKFAIDQILEEL